MTWAAALALGICVPRLFVSGPSASQLFAAHCSACHGTQAEGIPGLAPPLAGRELARARAQILNTVLSGLSGPIEVSGENYDGVMPSFAALDDAEIAVLVDYVISLGAPTQVPVARQTTPVEVAEARKITMTAAELRARRRSEFSDATASH